jgi:16S rRNA processing protein RimM
MAGPTGPTNEKVGHSVSSGATRPELRYLAIGRIIRAHGLRGEVSVVVLTEFPERFDTTEWVYLGHEYEATAYRLVSYRWHKDNVLLTLAGVNDRTQAEALRGQFVQVPVDEAVTLPEGDYYLYQLIDLKVQTTTGEFLGTIVNILETGANDVYIVEHNGREILLPAIPEVIKSVDLLQGVMVIEAMEGLI